MDLKTDILNDDAPGISAAADILRAGGLVAFPTETVYGLGADARNDMAVARIFDAKGRPRFNPLIVHVASIKAAQGLVEWSDMADRLAGAFWPGPLTLVLPLKPNSGLSPLVTAELPTLAIRLPAHPVGQALLTAFDGPIAAPSANPSGRISPTTADHVEAGLSGKVDAIVAGGACDVGLESTIIGLHPAPRLLRPGGLPTTAIEAALGAPLEAHGPDESITAPGQMTSHYAPDAPMRLNARAANPGEVLLGFGDVAGDLTLSASGDLVEAAANLFGHLHRLNDMAKPIAVAPIPKKGLGIAINDRLKRAAAPR
ncbi:MAG: L-threonylcarbamoyladenylate synthase [Pseudomonadota bacterium]